MSIIKFIIVAILIYSVCHNSILCQELVKETVISDDVIFVIDGTISMTDYRKKVVQSVKAICEAEFKDKMALNLKLIMFYDPLIEMEVMVENNCTRFGNIVKTQLNKLKGNDDCMEPVFEAISIAVDNANYNADLYVFTDAAAKDGHLLNSIRSKVHYRRLGINIILYNDDSNRDTSCQKYYPYYQRQSLETGGIMYEVDDLIEMPWTIFYSAFQKLKHQKMVLIDYGNYDVSSVHKFKIKIDDTMEKLVLIATGKLSEIRIYSDDDINTSTLMSEKNIIIKTVVLDSSLFGTELDVQIRAKHYSVAIATNYHYGIGFSDTTEIESLESVTWQINRADANTLKHIVIVPNLRDLTLKELFVGKKMFYLNPNTTKRSEFIFITSQKVDAKQFENVKWKIKGNSFLSHNFERHIFPGKKLYESAALNVVTPIKLREFNESITELITLKCNVVPLDLQPQWLLNDIIISEPNLSGSNLMVKPLRNASGTYTCKAEQDSIEASDEMEVVINYPPSPTKIFNGDTLLKNTATIPEKDHPENAILNCKSDGNPINYKWTLNGREFSFESSILINTSTASQSGNYICEAYNVLGSSQIELILDVIPYRSYGPWNELTPCNVSCGGGMRSRIRNCLNLYSKTIDPSECREQLHADNIEYLACDQPPCPIDGQWGDWSVYGPCSATCIKSKTEKIYWDRARECNNPAPQYGGLDCMGSATEREECLHLPLCSVDGVWSDWKFSESCPKCYFENMTKPSSTQSRQCDSPPRLGDGKDCEGASVEIKLCNIEVCSDELCQGSVEVKCGKGFKKECNFNMLQNECIDIDECSKKKSLCRNGKCVNTVGSYECECKEGYVVHKDKMKCIDLDECSENPSICKGMITNSICFNTIGSFLCICPQDTKLDNNVCIEG